MSGAKAGSEPYPGTQAIRRAIGLLKAFTEVRPEWMLAELARESGLNKTTAYRVLSALEAEGLVQRTAHGAYRLGPGLITLGHLAVRSTDLRALSRPELVALARETGETATLEVPVGGEVMILDEVKGPDLVGARADIGTRWPLHATSTGKALLAVASSSGPGDPDLPLPLPLSLQALTPRTLTAPDALLAEFHEIRRRGYAIAREELELGYVAVGAALLNHEGRPVAAVSVGGPANRFPADRLPELGARLRASADRVSARLGAPAGLPTAV